LHEYKGPVLNYIGAPQQFSIDRFFWVTLATGPRMVKVDPLTVLI